MVCGFGTGPGTYCDTGESPIRANYHEIKAHLLKLCNCKETTYRTKYATNIPEVDIVHSDKDTMSKSTREIWTYLSTAPLPEKTSQAFTFGLNCSMPELASTKKCSGRQGNSVWHLFLSDFLPCQLIPPILR